MLKCALHTLHFSRQIASEVLQRYAPDGADSGGSAEQGTIVFIPSRTIVSESTRSKTTSLNFPWD